MTEETGRIGDADRATRPSAQAPAGLGHTASIPCAERLKLDRRIRNQRAALRDNWMIMEQRERSHRAFTLAAIRALHGLCDALGVDRGSDQGGHYTLLYRAEMATAIAMARDSAETACPAPVPQDCQARANGIAHPIPHSNPKEGA